MPQVLKSCLGPSKQIALKLKAPKKESDKRRLLEPKPLPDQKAMKPKSHFYRLQDKAQERLFQWQFKDNCWSCKTAKTVKEGSIGPAGTTTLEGGPNKKG